MDKKERTRSIKELEKVIRKKEEALQGVLRQIEEEDDRIRKIEKVVEALALQINNSVASKGQKKKSSSDEDSSSDDGDDANDGDDEDEEDDEDEDGSEELKQLKRKGYLVVPCIGADEVKGTREQFRATLAAMPEFKHGQAMLNFGSNEPHSSFRDKPVPFVGGGFGALGNPSSFHNAFARNVRKQAHSCVLEAVFKEMLQRDPNLKFEQVIDRMMFRRAGQAASAESWHRDESKHAKEGDHIFGGWINLDDFNQTFSGIPESHSEVGLRNGGFATIPKTKHAELNRSKKAIAIPPGHILIFYERMVHEVVSKKLKKDQHRIFLGWRTTKQTTPLTPNLRALLGRQSVIPIKSGQIPPMYPQLYWTNWRDKILKPWSDEFIKDAVKETRELKTTGQEYNIVQQHITKGLVELKTKLGVNSRDYPPYTPAEISMYHPSREGLVSQNDKSSDSSSSDSSSDSSSGDDDDGGDDPPPPPGKVIRVERFPDEEASSPLLPPLVAYLLSQIEEGDTSILINCHAGQNRSALIIVKLMVALCPAELESLKRGEEPLEYTALRRIAGCYDSDMDPDNTATWPKFCMKPWTQEFIWPSGGRRSDAAKRWPKGKPIVHEKWLRIPIGQYTFYICSKDALDPRSAKVDVHIDLDPRSADLNGPEVVTVDAPTLLNDQSAKDNTTPDNGRRHSARNKGKPVSYREDSSSEDVASEREEGSEYSAPDSVSSEDDINSDEEDDAKKGVNDLLHTSEDENVDDELNDVAENNEEKKGNQAESRSIRKQMMAKYRPIIQGHMQWLLKNVPDEFKPTMRVIVANSMSTAKSCRYLPHFDFWQPLIEKVFRESGVEFANLVHNTSFDKSRLRDERQVFYTVVRGHAIVVVTEPGKNPLLFDSNGVITRDGDRLRTFGTQSLPLEVVYSYDPQRCEHTELWERLLIGSTGRCASWSLFTSLLLKSTTTYKAKAFLENITKDRARVVSQLIVNLFMRIISVNEEPFHMTPMEKYFRLGDLNNWKQDVEQLHKRWKEEVYPSRQWSMEQKITMGVLKNPGKAVQTKVLLERLKKGENIVLSGAQPGRKSVMIYMCMPYGMNPAEQGRNFKITCTIPKSFNFTTWGQVVEHMCKFPKLDNFFSVKDLFQLSEYDIYKHPSGGQWYKTEGKNLDQPRNRQLLSTPWIIQPHTPFVYKHYTLRQGELPQKLTLENVGNRRIELHWWKLPQELNIPVTLFGAHIGKFTTNTAPRQSTQPVKEYLKRTNPSISLEEYAFKSWGWPLAGVKIHYNATEKLLQDVKYTCRNTLARFVPSENRNSSFGPADAYAAVMERKKEKAEISRQKFVDFVEKTAKTFAVPHLHEDWKNVTHLFDDEDEWEKMGLHKARRSKRVGVHVNTPIIKLYVNVDVCPVYGFRRVTGTVATNYSLPFQVSLDWVTYESPEMTVVRKEMDEKLKELQGSMSILQRCKYHKHRKDPEKGKAVLETEAEATKKKDACLMSIQSLRVDYEVKCSESKREWYEDWKKVEQEYDKHLRRAHQNALDKTGLPKWRSTEHYYDTSAKFHVGNARYTEWWKSKWLRHMAVHGIPEIIAKCLIFPTRKLTFYIVGSGFQEDFDVENVKRYLLADARFEVVVEDGRAVSIKDPLGDFLSKLDIRLVPSSARMRDLLEDHLGDENRYVILTGGKGYNTFRYKRRVIDIKL